MAKSIQKVRYCEAKPAATSLGWRLQAYFSLAPTSCWMGQVWYGDIVDTFDPRNFPFWSCVLTQLHPGLGVRQRVGIRRKVPRRQFLVDNRRSISRIVDLIFASCTGRIFLQWWCNLMSYLRTRNNAEERISWVPRPNTKFGVQEFPSRLVDWVRVRSAVTRKHHGKMAAEECFYVAISLQVITSVLGTPSGSITRYPRDM